MMSRNVKSVTPPRLLLAAALAVLLAAAGARAQEGGAGGPRPMFRHAKAVGESPAPDAFEFELDGYSYRVANNGNGRRVKGDAVRPFNLRLTGQDVIERVQFAEYRGNLLLVCEVSDGETGGGLVLRLEQPSMRARWRAEVPAFNVGPPLRDGGHIYLTGIGFVAKLELETGRFAWRRGNLYQKGGPGTFNAFELPELSGDAVLFREAVTHDPAKTVTALNHPPKTLRVHRKTGKILGIE